MRKLFLVALVVGVCTPAVMAQETAKSGIYGGLLNLYSNAAGTSKRDVPKNLRFKAPETGKEDVNILPPAKKSTVFSAVSHETGEKYVNDPIFNSRRAAGGTRGPVQCPPNCPSGDYNKSEVYVGYSYLSRDFRIRNIIDDDIGDVDLIDFDDLKDRFGMHGIDLSYTYNFSRYVGVQVDFSYHRKTRDFDFDFFDPDAGLNVIGDVDGAKFRVFNLLFGIQVKDNEKGGSWFRPFGHALAGFSRERLDLEDAIVNVDIDNDGDLDTITFGVDDDLTFKRTSFALALGGGIDIRISDNFSIRAVKFDYLPVWSRRPVLFLDASLPIDPDFDFFFLDDDSERKIQQNFRVGAGIVFHW